MKQFFKVFMVSLLISGLMSCQEREETSVTSNDLLINVISDATKDPHSSTMGFHLAQKALKQNMEVTVFLNVHGVKLMLPQADTIVFHHENLQDLLADIVQKGGNVLACPHCMEVEGVKEEDLMDGVNIAEDTLLIDVIKKGPGIFSY